MKKYRYGVEDIILTEKQVEKLVTKYCVQVIVSGEIVAEPELYLVEEEKEEE